ncbi:MAG: hypothetical protein ACK4NE_00170 [Albidovulum sp.]
MPHLDDIAVILIGIGVGGALVLFVFGVWTELDKKERDDGPV